MWTEKHIADCGTQWIIITVLVQSITAIAEDTFRFNDATDKVTTNHHTTHHNHLTAFFRDHPGKPVPKENFWTLWCKGRLTEADTQTIQLGTTSSGLTSAQLHHNPPNHGHKAGEKNSRVFQAFTEP